MGRKETRVQRATRLIYDFLELTSDGRKAYVEKLANEDGAPDWVVDVYLEEKVSDARFSGDDYMKAFRVGKVVELLEKFGRDKEALKLLVDTKQDKDAEKLARRKGMLEELAAVHASNVFGDSWHYRTAAKIMESEGKYDEAMRYSFDKAMYGATRDFSEDVFEKIVEYSGRLEDWKKRRNIEDVVLFLSENSSNPELKSVAGDILCRRGKVDEALECCVDSKKKKEVKQLAERNGKLSSLLRLYEKKGMFDEAVELVEEVGSEKDKKRIFRKAARYYERNSGGYYKAAGLRKKLGNEKEAKRLFIEDFANHIARFGADDFDRRSIYAEGLINYGFGGLVMDLYLKSDNKLDAVRLAKRIGDERAGILYKELIKSEMKRCSCGDALNLISESEGVLDSDGFLFDIYMKERNYDEAVDVARKGGISKGKLKKVYDEIVSALESKGDYERLSDYSALVGNSEKEKFYSKLNK